MALLLAGVVGAAITALATTRPTRHHSDRVRSWLVGARGDRRRARRALAARRRSSRSRRAPGNLGTLVRFFRDHGREHSYGDAWHVVASQLSAWPDWLHGGIVRNIYSGAVDLSGSTPIAVSALVLRRRRRAHVAPGQGRVPARRAARAHDRRRGRVGEPRSSARSSRTSSPGPGRSGCSRGSRSRGRSCGGGRTRSATDPRGRTRRARRRRGRARGRVRRATRSTPRTRRQPRRDPDPAGSRPDDEGARRAAAGRRRRRDPGRHHAGLGLDRRRDRRRSSSTTASRRGSRPTSASPTAPTGSLDGEPVRLVVLPVEDPDLAATRELPCFEDAGRVGKYILFVGEPSPAPTGS